MATGSPLEHRCPVCRYWQPGAAGLRDVMERKKDYAQALEFLVRLRSASPLKLDPKRPQRYGAHSQLGENDRAFEVLEGMIQARRVMIAHMDSALDWIRCGEIRDLRS